ncbi:hypothetical protein CRE_12877 [Caenorhabditis remanei]|uniref:Uncharacterized protein n=1 Tax=Caenorhabditis remanei TaxID=31234 RepID=E3MQR2_CAERE|nr:hypothetical protein CRE_12877 [Caenorhabditis remanei]
MYCQVTPLLLLSVFVYYTKSDQLDDARQSCKTQKIQIPSGRTVSSEVIALQYRDLTLSNIIHDECEEREEPEYVRTKRGVGRALKSFSEIGKKVYKGAKSAYKATQPYMKTFKKTGKYGAKALRNGAKLATSDFALDALDMALDSKWDLKKAVESSEEYEQDEEDRPSRRIEKQLDEFRGDLLVLLDENIIQGHIRQTASVKKIVKEMTSLELKASDAHCYKDGFTGRYSIRLRVETDEKMTAVAKHCEDIGEVLKDKNGKDVYEFYEITNEFLVERDEISYIVNSTGCRQNNREKVLKFCPETLLRREDCSVMSVEHCKKSLKDLSEDKKISRILPTGLVYYGPAELLTLERKGQSLKVLMNPYHLEYIRIFDRDRLIIGNDVVYG